MIICEHITTYQERHIPCGVCPTCQFIREAVHDQKKLRRLSTMLDEMLENTPSLTSKIETKLIEMRECASTLS